MNINVVHQDKYSRLELLARTFFGPIYIIFPHYFILAFVAIGAMVVNFIAFWVVLFTGKYPRGMFDFMVGYQAWILRVVSSVNNLCDGYPSFGLNAKWPPFIFEIEYPETCSRGLLLLRAFFGPIYIALPHVFCLSFRAIAHAFISFIAFWAILFTGKYPKDMHDFCVGTFRWLARYALYSSFLTDQYPPFSGK